MNYFFGTASVLKRILAFIMDILIINAIIINPFMGLVSKIIGPVSSYSALIEILKGNALVTRDLSIIVFFIAMLSLLYFSLLEWKIRQTLGQIIMGLYVAGNNKKITFWQCIVSNLFMLPFFPFFLLWFVDPVFLFLENQRFSEKIANLKVVQMYVMPK